jgi:hypothetical protein
MIRTSRFKTANENDPAHHHTVQDDLRTRSIGLHDIVKWKTTLTLLIIRYMRIAGSQSLLGSFATALGLTIVKPRLSDLRVGITAAR